MYVLPGILREEVVEYFDEDGFDAFRNVLDDILSSYVRQYMENPEANQSVVRLLQDKVGKTVKSLTLQKDCEERGILELVRGLTPASLSAGIDLQDIIDKLSYLEDNFDYITTYIPVRTSSDYSAFYQAVKMAGRRYLQYCENAGEDTGLLSIAIQKELNCMSANSFIFASAHEKTRSTNLSVLVSRKRMWVMSLRGAEFQIECAKRNIPQSIRRNF